MSREIKFRAWDGEKIDHEPTFGETSFGGSYVNSFNNDFQKRIFMQYTGLLDKHGKEIYEGDILGFVLRTPLGLVKSRGVMEWHKERAGFEIKSYAPEEAYIYEEIEGQPEILGNIYENPELLK